MIEDGFLNRIQGDALKYQPSLICVQYDPMIFLHHFREYSCENSAYFNEIHKTNYEQGIFGKEDQEDIMMEMEENIENLHQEEEAYDEEGQISDSMLRRKILTERIK